MDRLEMEYFYYKQDQTAIEFHNFMDDCILTGAYFEMKRHGRPFTEEFKSDIWMYYAYLNDITFHFVVTPQGYIDQFRNNAIQDAVFHFDIRFKEYGKGREAMRALEELIDDGRIVMVQTVNQILKFSRFYRENFDLALYQPRHGMFALWHEEDRIYLCDSKMHIDTFQPYQGRQDIAIVPKSELFPALNHYCSLAVFHLDPYRIKRVKDRMPRVISSSVHHYYEELPETAERFSGRQAILKMIALCEEKRMRFDTPLNNGAPYADTFLWYLEQIEIKRKLFLICLTDYASSCTSIDCAPVVDSTKQSIECWQIVRNVARKRYQTGKYEIDDALKSPLLRALDADDRLFRQLAAISRQGLAISR